MAQPEGATAAIRVQAPDRFPWALLRALLREGGIRVLVYEGEMGDADSPYCDALIQLDGDTLLRVHPAALHREPLLAAHRQAVAECLQALAAARGQAATLALGAGLVPGFWLADQATGALQDLSARVLLAAPGPPQALVDGAALLAVHGAEVYLALAIGAGLGGGAWLRRRATGPLLSGVAWLAWRLARLLARYRPRTADRDPMPRTPP